MDAAEPRGGAGGGGAGEVVPDEAPTLLWLLLAAALVLWWLWPWLERWRAEARPGSASAAAPPLSAAAAGAAAAAAAARAVGPAPSSGDTSSGGGPLLDEAPEADTLGGGPVRGQGAEELGFDLLEEFGQAFTGAALLISQALSGPPSGQAYTAANAALHQLSEILDRAFQAFGSPEELAKVTRLREASEAFAKSFGNHRLGGAMRQLLCAAGFERQSVPGREETGDDAVWVFPHAEATARLHGLTVRLCLQKFKELQRLRGPARWLHKNNDAVVPKLEDAAFIELLDLYKESEGSASELRASARERNLEANVRIAISRRRAERGLAEPLALHKGLAGTARALADAQRVRARTDRGGGELACLPPGAGVAEEIRSRVAALPLPPGFSVAHLHWSSSELPRLFGLASTKGGGGQGADALTAGRKDPGESDQAADILASEAVGFWAVRQECDMFWPAATICGVGAALDYTVNKGFVVALLLGFERSRPAAADAGGLPEEEGTDSLRRRPASALAAAARKRAAGGGGASQGPPPPHGDAPPPRRIVGLNDLSRPGGG